MEICKVTEYGTYICMECGEEFPKRRGFCKHYSKDHVPLRGVKGLAAVSKLAHGEITDIPLPVLEEYYIYMDDKMNNERQVNKFFSSYYNLITSMREFNIKKDVKNFFDNLLPWRMKHPKDNSSEEMANLVFQNSKEASIYLEKLNSSRF